MTVRMKHTHGKAGSARAHKHALAPRLTGTGGAVRRRHFADPETGTYRGKVLLSAVKAVRVKKSEKRTAGGGVTRAVGARTASKRGDGAGKATEKK